MILKELQEYSAKVFYQEKLEEHELELLSNLGTCQDYDDDGCDEFNL